MANDVKLPFKVPFIRSPYNYDLKAASDESASIPKGDSLTVQSMSEDADINNIVRRFGLTGKMPDIVHVPSYGDFDGISNYMDALAAVRLAESSFMELPADMRMRFVNDPQKFLEFCSQEGNRGEMIKLGLMKPGVHETPVAVVPPVVPEVKKE